MGPWLDTVQIGMISLNPISKAAHRRMESVGGG